MFEEAIQKSTFTKNQNVISKRNGFRYLSKNSDKIVGNFGYRKVYGIRDIKLRKLGGGGWGGWGEGQEQEREEREERQKEKGQEGEEGGWSWGGEGCEKSNGKAKYFALWGSSVVS